MNLKKLQPVDRIVHKFFSISLTKVNHFIELYVNDVPFKNTYKYLNLTNQFYSYRMQRYFIDLKIY